VGGVLNTIAHAVNLKRKEIRAMNDRYLRQKGRTGKSYQKTNNGCRAITIRYGKMAIFFGA
jgi:hypothetical protein